MLWLRPRAASRMRRTWAAPSAYRYPIAGGVGIDGMVQARPAQQVGAEERAQLMAELDAAYFILYGIDREDAAYILSTFSKACRHQPALTGAPTVAEQILDTYDWLRSH